MAFRSAPSQLHGDNNGPEDMMPSLDALEASRSGMRLHMT